MSSLDRTFSIRQQFNLLIPTAMADEIERSSEEIAPDGKLPGDVMVSILTNLPVKSLMKFKAVSKPWCSLISSSRFSKLHLHRQSLVPPNNNNCLMVLGDDSGLGDRKYGLLDLSSNFSTPADDDVLILEISPSLPPEQRDLNILDSCNGLVCLGSFKIESSDLILWNPATRRYRLIDLPKKGDDLRFNTLGMCYVDAIDDFKILVWNNIRHPSPVLTPNLYVYSLTSDSWDKLEYDNPKIDIHFFRPTYMFRCMHWVSNACPNSYDCTCTSGNEIVAVDVMDGAMTWYRLPVNCSRHGITLKKTFVSRGCLSIVILCASVFDDVDIERERGIEVWVMEEYGVEGSWVKRFRIQQDLSQFMSPYVTWIYGEIVIHSMKDASKVLTFYDPYSEKKSYLEFLSYRVSGLFNYVESLAYVGN